jgi:hypothetical protein
MSVHAVVSCCAEQYAEANQHVESSYGDGNFISSLAYILAQAPIEQARLISPSTLEYRWSDSS